MYGEEVIIPQIWACYELGLFFLPQLYRENPDEYLAEDVEEEVPADPKSPVAEMPSAPILKKEKAVKVVKEAVRKSI